MRLLRFFAYLVGAVACTTAAVVLFWPSGSSTHVRTPLEVAAAFAYHVDRGNYGKACGLYTAEARGGTVQACSQGFVYNDGINMAFFGIDVYDGARIVPGSQHVVDEDTVTFEIATDEIPPAKLTVERQPSGRWRVSKIGG